MKIAVQKLAGLMTEEKRKKNAMEMNEPTRSVKGIMCTTDQVQITIPHSEQNSLLNHKVFELLAKQGISVDRIHILENQQAFIISGNDTIQVERVLLGLSVEYHLISNCSRISILCNNTRNKSDIQSKLLKTLEESDVSVLQMGDSPAAIWCLIHQDDNSIAVNQLYRIFF